MIELIYKKDERILVVMECNGYCTLYFEDKLECVVVNKEALKKPIAELLGVERKDVNLDDLVKIERWN